ncbi:hypothetical protein P691DRAFT_765828 [Macrolepiota fuliginosa MF-IS2]|uniref:Nephrocystin 3-like N-terminal domain-containing protein n=1 Tax=Macrolepiota fuliginosa MF-IS2 TaxID=1400762 RepID=A0A9P5X1Q2_9AGAR|nr:hypothetical protein P691DRAFT_765828 [Macrolepiota fuliginosa MF-IS2]
MPTLTNPRNTTITGGHFTDRLAGVINNISLANERTGIDILLEASNRDAGHDSSARDYAPRCHLGTPKQYLEDIAYWAVGTGDPSPLVWIKGPAGVGKSAIAQTCAERLGEQDRLGAAFFFSVNGQGKAAEFIPTIVYQLSMGFPNYRDLVDRRICYDKAIFSKTMAVQFAVLIIEPLRELERVGKGIGKRIAIIVDGLDECNDIHAQCKIIEIIATAAHDGVIPFCWAFFSRPEPHIEASFSLVDVTRVVLLVSNETSLDIELYLRSSFENILRRRNILWNPNGPVTMIYGHL